MGLIDSINADKHNFKIKNKIMIEPDMYYSQAFKSLSASALRTLMRCLQKRKWNRVKVDGKKRTVYSNDGFIFPYAEAKLLGIGTTQFWKNRNRLVEVGFLDIIHKGGWYQKNDKEKDYSIYKLSERWRQYGTANFIRVEIPKSLNPEYYVRENLRKKLGATSQKRSRQLHKNEVDTAKSENDRLRKSEVDNKQEPSTQTLDNTV
jgi:hypothetical protein